MNIKKLYCVSEDRRQHLKLEEHEIVKSVFLKKKNNASRKYYD